MSTTEPEIIVKSFTVSEIDAGIKKLHRRIEEVNRLATDGVNFNDARVRTAETNIRETIRSVFGAQSPEFNDHEYHDIWHGGYNVGDDELKRQMKFLEGCKHTVFMLEGLISRLEETREDIGGSIEKKGSPIDFWDDIHPKITSVAKSRFESKHYADAVESALKEVNSCVKAIFKERTGSERDGADLMHKAFSPSNPIIVLDDLSTESGKNIQQGYMEIFAGAMIGIRNPKAHANITIDKKRAIHFMYFASLLMHVVDEKL